MSVNCWDGLPPSASPLNHTHFLCHFSLAACCIIGNQSLFIFSEALVSPLWPDSELHPCSCGEPIYRCVVRERWHRSICLNRALCSRPDRYIQLQGSGASTAVILKLWYSGCSDSFRLYLFELETIVCIYGFVFAVLNLVYTQFCYNIGFKYISAWFSLNVELFLSWRYFLS